MPAALGIGALVGVGSSLISSGVKAKSAKKAADAQKVGIENAKADINTNYDKAQEFQSPYLDAGKQTIAQLLAGLQAGGEFNRSFTEADFQKDPGYDFRMQQGLQAVERGAAARGGALSGAALKGAQNYGQNLASQEYQSAYSRFNNDTNQRFNRLSEIAGRGQSAANVSTASSQRRGETLGDLSVNRGNVNAAKNIAYGNAATNAVNTIGNAVGGYFGGMPSVGGGNTISDYTGGQMQDWIKSGGSTSYGR